jgi:hypothetical protein
MAPPSLRATSPPEQDEHRCLGERDDWPHRLKVYETGEPGVAELRRYRVVAYPPYDPVAEIHHAGGVVSKTSWDERHQVKDLDSWRASAETWIKACIAQDWSDR